eukprot:SAG31_NODE_38355_length_296_cov_8.309645_2_plen_43_part_01
MYTAVPCMTHGTSSQQPPEQPQQPPRIFIIKTILPNVLSYIHS